MKILDRYLIISLLLPFAFCLGAFFCLWIVFDLFDIIGDLVTAKASLWFIVQFYGVQIPRIAQIILPPSFFFSCVYLLAYMSSRRELVATMAAGISLYRIAAPFLIVSILVSCIQYAFYFNLTPGSKSRVDGLKSILAQRPEAQDIYQKVLYKNPANGAMWFISEINLTEGSFKQAEILNVDEIGRDREKLFIARGTFKGKYWDLFNVRKVTFNADGSGRPAQDIDQLDALSLNETPEQLVATLRPAEELSWMELHQFINAKYRPSPNRMAPYQMEYFYRMTYPLISPILCLFAFAFGISFERHAKTSSLASCLLLLFGLLIFLNISVALGNGKRLDPALAAWSTILLFGSIGSWLFALKVGWVWELSSILKSQYAPRKNLQGAE
jgi:lipopolysaccharide export system permease protein